MVQKYLTIFRAVNNFIQVGEGGKTQAMRLGLAERPMTYHEMLWPDGEARQPNRARRSRTFRMPSSLQLGHNA